MVAMAMAMEDRACFAERPQRRAQKGNREEEEEVEVETRRATGKKKQEGHLYRQRGFLHTPG